MEGRRAVQGVPEHPSERGLLYILEAVQRICRRIPGLFVPYARSLRSLLSHSSAKGASSSTLICGDLPRACAATSEKSGGAKEVAKVIPAARVRKCVDSSFREDASDQAEEHREPVPQTRPKPRRGIRRWHRLGSTRHNCACDPQYDRNA